MDYRQQNGSTIERNPSILLEAAQKVAQTKAIRRKLISIKIF